MSDLFTVRYPSGAKEFRVSADTPNVGDILTRNGDEWIVEEVTEDEKGKTQLTLGRGSKLAEPPA